MTPRTIPRIGIGFLILTALIILAAFWYWALFGLSEDVGTAIGATVFIGLIAGFGCVVSSA